MKKSISLLILLLSVIISASAQNITGFSDFVFSKPLSLNPSVQEPYPGNSSISVNGMTFHSGPVSITISSDGVPASIDIDTNYGFMLKLYRSTYLTIKGNGVNLTSFSLDNNSTYAGLTLVEGQPGKFTSKGWVCDGEVVHELKLINTSATSSKITSFTVGYESPADILLPKSISPADNSVVCTPDFSGVTLTFASNIVNVNKELISFTNISDNTITGTVCSVFGNTVTVSPVTALSPGTYNLCIGTSAIVDADGFYNKPLISTFTLHDPQNTFNPLTLPGGKVNKVPANIEIPFPGIIGNYGRNDDINDLVNLSLPLINITTGETVAMATFSLKEGNTKTLVASLTPNVDITANGVYNLSIPEKSVYNIMYKQGADKGELWNATLNLEFIVGDVYVPSDAIKRKVNTALSLSGLGYPKTTAAERIALVDALNAAVNCFSGSEAELNALVDAFYSSTDVQLPESGKYYSVANIAKNGNKLYLSYNDGSINLTNSENDAARFYVTKTEAGDYVFTINNMYLHTLTNNNRYIGTSTTNLLSDYIAELNDIKVARLFVSGVDNSVTIGKFSLYGAIGRKTEGGAMSYAYSLVDTSSGLIDLDPDGGTWFNDHSSSAFILEETSEPDPEISYTLSPETGSHVTDLKYVNVTINGVANVIVDTSKSITLTKGSLIQPLTNISVGGENNNVITITIAINDDDTYTLNIPKGALKYEYKGRLVDVPAISAIYYVALSDKFVYNFDQVYNVYCPLKDDKSYHPSDLNYFYIYTDQTEIHIDESNNYCDITDYFTGKVISDGKLTSDYTYTSEYYDYFYKNGVKVGMFLYFISDNTLLVRLPNGDDQKYMYNKTTDEIRKEEVRTYIYNLRFKMNKWLDETNMPDSRYFFSIPRGTYGDSNFGLYLTNPSAVTKSECHLNEVGSYYFNTSKNAIPMGIIEVKENTSSDDIYDISGRKVLSAEKPGMYIKNGKKFIVK